MAEFKGNVFVSSRMWELKKERAALMEVFDDLGVERFFFEDVGSDDRSIQEIFLEAVAEYDIYLGVFWKTSGKYTEEEYDSAYSLDKPKLLYQKLVTEPDVRDIELKEFLDAAGDVETGSRIAEFEDAEQLGKLVRQDLIKLLVRKVKANDNDFSSTNKGAEGNAARPSQACPTPSSPPKPEVAARRQRRAIGRDDELAPLLEAIAAPEPVLTGFWGSAGVGKTLLTKTLAHPFNNSLEQYEAGVAWLDAESKPIEDFYQDIYTAFCGGITTSGDAEDATAEKATADHIRELFAKQRSLLLIDNADWQREEVQDLIDLMPHTSLVLGAAERRSLRDAQPKPVALKDLEPEEARELFLDETDAEIETDEEEQAIAEICRFAGNNPDRILHLANIFAEGEYSIMAMYGAVQGWGSLDKAVRESLSDDQETSAMLGLMAAVDAKVPHAVLTKALGGDPAEVLTFIVDDLELARRGSPRYQLAGDLAADIRDEWVNAGTINELFNATISWVESSSPAALVDDHGYIYRLLERGVADQLWVKVLKLAKLADPSFMLGGHWEQWRQVIEWARLAASHLGDAEAEAWALHQLGSRAMGLKERLKARAYFNQAIDRREEMGDWRGAALSRHNRGLLPMVVAVTLIFWFVALGTAVGLIVDPIKPATLEMAFGDVPVNTTEERQTMLTNPTDGPLSFWVSLEDSGGDFCLPECPSGSSTSAASGSPPQALLAAFNGAALAQSSQPNGAPCSLEEQDGQRRRVRLSRGESCELMVRFRTAEVGSHKAFLDVAAVETGEGWRARLTANATETNQNPALAAIANQSGTQGSSIRFDAAATDPDLPAQTLTFSLDDTAPGHSLPSVYNWNATTGVFSWIPSESEVGESHTFVVVVTDNGTPNLTDTQTITVSAIDSPPTTPPSTTTPTTTTPVPPLVGSITIATSAAPDDGTSFDFSRDFGSGFAQRHGDALTFGDLAPGTYSVTEAVASGWLLVGLTCSDGSATDLATATANVLLEADEDVTCTFSNEKPAPPTTPTLPPSAGGSITIAMSAAPNDGTSFGFSRSFGSSFAQRHGDAVTFAGLAAGAYSVTETVASEWRLIGLTCSDGSAVDLATATANVQLGAGEDVTCTFSNERLGSITIEKFASPSDGTLFALSGSLGPFSLANGDSATFRELVPGTYAVTELAPAGWVLTGLACSDGSPTDRLTATATVGLGAGEGVTCTFTSVAAFARADITPELVSFPSGGQVTVTNIGNTAFTVDSLSFSVGSGLFDITADGCSSARLGPAESCILEIAPSGPGPRVGVLNISYQEAVEGDATVLLVVP